MKNNFIIFLKRDGSFFIKYDIIISMNEPEIIYEDDNFLAVNKPAGMLVHEARIVKHEAQKEGHVPDFRIQASSTLVDWLLKNYPEIKGVGDEPEIRPGIVHRLDKDTSGVIIVAKNQKSFDYFKNLFQKHEIKKTYLALALGGLKSGTGIINKPIRLKNGTIKRTVWEGKDEKQAITEYKVLEYLKITTERGGQIFSLLEVYPKTGRTHQIRVHLASTGHPIIGDLLYGPKNNFGLKRQFLHAKSIEFTDLSGKRMKIESDLSDDLKNFLANFEKD